MLRKSGFSFQMQGSGKKFKYFWEFCICIFLVFSSDIVFSVNVTVDDYQPSQVHISFGNKLNEIVVTWTTASKTHESFVEYGVKGLVERAVGNQTVFEDGGIEKRKFYIHRVLLPNLQENATYEYHCGSNLGWSDLFSFHTPLYGTDWSPHFAIYGDMGSVNAVSLPRLQKEAQARIYDAIFHVGDMAYNMDSDNGRIGDEFMKQIEPIAAYVPYMTTVGNHEQKYNFSHYRLRFSMPGDSQGLFYSFNIGPIHFIAISTEVYYFFKDYGIKPLINQYEWLKKDLKEATAPENRTIRPWIITMGHRPMYCSNADEDDCTFRSDFVRVGIFPFGNFGLEDMFYQHGVDIEIWAHEHSYERTWPLYDYKVYNGTPNPYINPEAPIHVVTGSAGCNEYVDHFKNKVGDWSAFRSSDYGYTRLKVHNSSHLHFEQVSDNKDGLVIDDFWVVKEKHEAYPKRNLSKKKKYSTEHYFVTRV